ncbi:hypothetical protein MtrunA17_Chr6g0473911 [Medicago truncatula]|uniref:Uncharacterized protein n=1 Tax=Medicago truncatula TaxID=3880 RepID=A0A396HGZ7_MEDTR|nr:hypothetical protein MtrunA17_Chr6g0473911 [Medicago truncatula]
MENFGNFTMYAKDREAAGAVCLTKGRTNIEWCTCVGFHVQGNAGGEIDKRVMKDLVSLRTFHMEYDICSR